MPGKYKENFNVSSIKFEPLRKKDQSADQVALPSEKTQRSKDADAHNPSETAFSDPPPEILVHRGGGGGCILNRMALPQLPSQLPPLEIEVVNRGGGGGVVWILNVIAHFPGSC